MKDAVQSRSKPKTTRAPGTGACPDLVPDEIRNLAAERGFGELIDIRREVTTAMALISGWGIAGASFAMMGLISSLGRDVSPFSLSYSLLRAAVVFFLFISICGFAFGIRGLITGSHVHYLYIGGLVHKSRNGLQAVAWPEVTLLRTLYKTHGPGQGAVLGFRLNAEDGTSYTIPLSLVNGSDEFIDRVVAYLRAHGRPIF